MTIGKRLRERRENAGLTQGQVSEYEEISRSYVSNLERGQNDPEVWGLLAKLARRYRTSTDYLLGLTDDPRPLNEHVKGVAEESEPHYAASLSPQQRAILEFFDSLDEDEQEFVLGLLTRFGGSDSPRIIG